MTRPGLSKHRTLSRLPLCLLLLTLTLYPVTWWAVERQQPVVHVPDQLLTVQKSSNAFADKCIQSEHSLRAQLDSLMRNTSKPLCGHSRCDHDKIEKLRSGCPQAIKVFQIGFHKAGTTTLFNLFTENGIPAVHWKMQQPGGHVFFDMLFHFYDRFFREQIEVDLVAHSVEHAQKMKAIESAKSKNPDLFASASLKWLGEPGGQLDTPLLGARLCNNVFFSDFGISPKVSLNKYLDPLYDLTHFNSVYWFELLDKAYPCSRFILNIRPVLAWLRSRNSHHKMAARYARHHEISVKQVYERWLRDWYHYNCKVLQHFDGPNSFKLLVLDITEDDIHSKVSQFLKPFMDLPVIPENVQLNNLFYNAKINVTQFSPFVLEQSMHDRGMTEFQVILNHCRTDFGMRFQSYS